DFKTKIETILKKEIYIKLNGCFSTPKKVRKTNALREESNKRMIKYYSRKEVLLQLDCPMERYEV
ncbi:unnamed protein product, partial [Larinioides sclopetarius]